MTKLRSELDFLIDEDEKHKEKIYEAEKLMLLLQTPNIWNTNVLGNMEVETEVEFEKFLVSLSEHTNEDMGDIVIFRFYVLIDLLTEKHKSNGRSDNSV